MMNMSGSERRVNDWGRRRAGDDTDEMG